MSGRLNYAKRFGRKTTRRDLDPTKLWTARGLPKGDLESLARGGRRCALRAKRKASEEILRLPDPCEEPQA